MNENTIDSIYDFCLDWQMNQISKLDLIRRFADNQWDFEQFKSIAQKRNWLVNSMYILLYSSDFVN